VEDDVVALSLEPLPLGVLHRRLHRHLHLHPVCTAAKRLNGRGVSPSAGWRGGVGDRRSAARLPDYQTIYHTAWCEVESLLEQNRVTQ
jgi:hypothetical protein